MKASEIISKTLPEALPEDTVGKVLGWMEECKVQHLPYLKDGNLEALLYEDDLLDQDESATIGSLRFARPLVFVLAKQHLFDAAKIMADTLVTVLPVVTESNAYVGMISSIEMLEAYHKVSNIKEPGSVVVLEMHPRDYSMLQIANIVEGNDGKILSSFVTNQEEGKKVEVTLKLNKGRIDGILQTFARYNYTVIEKYQESAYDSLLKERYDELMNYLNM